MILKKVLVTGGSGFIGSFLTKELVKRGIDVRVFDNYSRGTKKNLVGIDVELINGDICNKEDVQKATTDIDTIFHFAAIQGTRNFYEKPDRVLKVNLEGTLNVAEAAANSDVNRLIFASSSEAYGIPLSFPTKEESPLMVPDIKNPRYSYGASKIAGESICLNYGKIYGINIGVIRYHNVYGPMMGYDHVIPQFITRILNNEKFTIQGDGGQTRCFCYVSDAVEGTILAASNQKIIGDIFNIGTQDEIKIIEIAQHLLNISGSTQKIISVNPPKGETLRRIPDLTKATKILGYIPRISLIKGLKKTFNWYKTDLHNK